MPGLVKILGSWFFRAWVEDILGCWVQIKRILADYFLDSSLHHAFILLGVHMLGLCLVLHVLHFPNIGLILLIAFDAVVDAGRWSWWFIEECLELE